MHHVVIDLLTLVLLDFLSLAIINAEQIITEGRNHEELLHHTIHVANAPQVAQTHIFLIALT